MYGHIIDWVVVRTDDDIHKNILLQNHLNHKIKFYFNVSVSSSTQGCCYELQGPRRKMMAGTLLDESKNICMFIYMYAYIFI